MTDSQPITAIDGNAPTDAPDLQNAVNHIAHFVQSAAAAPSDSAVLSVTAQAQLLEQQGLSVVEIADRLGITASTVQSDLGIALAISQAVAAKA